MAKTAGVSGLAVALATAGGVLVFSAIRNASIPDALRDIVAGRKVGATGQKTGPAVETIQTMIDEKLKAAGTGMASQAASTKVETFVQVVTSQVGKPYVWGAAGPDSFDCSGLVTYGLKQAGLDNQRRYTWDYLAWSGATTVPRDQCRSGDLVCWSGHIGVAISNTEMVHAPTSGEVVKTAKIWNTPPPTIRRING